MSRKKIEVTESFRHLKMISDDIPTSIYQEPGLFYHFPIKMGGKDWAMLIVPEKTVERRPEYFK